MGSRFIAAAGRRAYKSGSFSIQRGPIILLIRITTRFLLGLAVAALVVASGPLHAQETQRIAAVVNDEVISIYDLVNRTRLAVISSGLPDSPETRRRVQPQVLRALIDEKIQAQEAARQNITASEADIQTAISRIEENNRMPPGGLEQAIANSGIEHSAVMGQIKATVLWQKLVNRRLRNTLQVGDDEVDEQLSRLKAAQGTPEYLLAEIFLAVDSPDQDDEVRQAALGLTEQLRRGTPFRDMARQFSQSASAASGGDIGWVQSGMLEADIEAAIENTPPGQLTEPVRSVGGYYIYAVRQRRIIAAASPNDATVTLVQMLLPFESGGAPAELDPLKELAETVRETVSGCADLKRLSEELKVPPPTDPQPLRVGDLAPRIRDIVSPLKVGEASAPIQIDRGLLLLMVCQREDAPSNMPTREDITENLLRQRLDLLSRRYLRDLRRAAFVDVRV